ncbi:phosphoribosylformylglycinamidine synthase subunit PurS [Bacillus niameyensis]|uniref:phosphoribosylformylglycinamidine synthase subunit PurS n=1 Tax=Bacillus niameyensis TaxID=1522308 RepID=UPI000785F7F1|nr:phosphoribosylformylglycinamidine synthase subunit PurS [Bacillus niameyensis]
MYKVKVFVSLKESVIDPQGTATKSALQKLDFSEVEQVRVGKFIELTLNKTDKNIEEAVHEMCKSLLVNEEVEEYAFEVEEVQGK